MTDYAKLEDQDLRILRTRAKGGGPRRYQGADKPYVLIHANDLLALLDEVEEARGLRTTE